MAKPKDSKRDVTALVARMKGKGSKAFTRPKTAVTKVIDKGVRVRNGKDNWPGVWYWNATRTLAAQMVAEDLETDNVIAQRADVSRNTLARWKRVPEFIEQVAANVRQFQDNALRKGIADRFRRIATYDKDFKRIETIIEERADSKEMQDIPGGKSGLLTMEMKSFGSGDSQQVIEQYRFDSALISARDGLRKQVAQELGQWTERQMIAAIVVKRIIGVADEDI